MWDRPGPRRAPAAVPARPPLLCVPVRHGPGGSAVRLFRTARGVRTAVAFTDRRRLGAALGPGHPWVVLAEPAVRALAEPLGVTALTVDPPLALTPARTPRTPRTAGPSRHSVPAA